MSQIIIKQLQEADSAEIITVAELIALKNAPVFAKSIHDEPAFRTNGNDLMVNGDIQITINSTVISATDGTVIALPSLSIGTDYAIYATADGIVVSDNFTAPPGYTELTSKRFAGFHYQDGFINEYSIWDLKYKPTCNDPRGMVRTVGGFWSDIYLLNTTPDLLGTSAYNATIADGSSPPKIPAVWGGNGTDQYPNFTQYIATEVLAAYGKRLPKSDEFEVLARGSVAGYAAGADPIKTMFDGSARSQVGCEQVSGHMYHWGAEKWDRGNGSSGYGWQVVDTNSEGEVYASGTSGVGASLFGAYWTSAGSAGSRASHWGNQPWSSGNGVGARGVCDHMQLV